MPNNPRDRASSTPVEPIDTHQVPRLWGFSLPKTCFAHRCPTPSYRVSMEFCPQCVGGLGDGEWNSTLSLGVRRSQPQGQTPARTQVGRVGTKAVAPHLGQRAPGLRQTTRDNRKNIATAWSLRGEGGVPLTPIERGLQ